MILTKKSLYIHILYLTTIFPNIVFAQQKGNTIKGTVQDSLQQKAIAFATVGLFKSANLQKPVQNTFTDNKGRFQFLKVDTGSWQVIVTHAGYHELFSAPFIVQSGSTEVELPFLQVVPAAANLKEVVISARRPLIEMNDEKLTYNSESDPSVDGLTATDVLRRTPFLSVDGDGNILLNGQSNYKVLLNGKETAMFTRNAKEALKAFPANLIKKVEVITSPSSKYDGEGVGGIINIITKKKVVGYNGSAGLSQNTINNSNGNFNMNFKYGKLGFSGYYGFGLTNGQESRTSSVTESFQPIAFYKRLSEGKGKDSYFYNYGNAELGWDLDSMNTVSIYADVNGGSTNQEIERYFDLILPNKTDTQRSTYFDNNEFDYPSFNWGTDFIRKFKRNAEQELTVKAYLENNRESSMMVSDQYSPGITRYIINENRSNNKQTTIQADYVHPFKNKSKLESGVKGIMRRAKADYTSSSRYDPSEKYLIDSANSDLFQYDQNVFSVYATYRFTIKDFSFRVGGRVEQTMVDGDFTTSQTYVQQDYTTFMPSLFISRKIKKIHTLSFTYSKRLRRPYIWDLNPFVNNTDTLNQYFGNPNLEPELYHTAEIAYSVFKGKTSINIRLSESYTNTQIARYSTFDDQTGVTYWTNDNIGSYASTGLSGNVSTSFTTKWKMNSNLGLRYDFVKNLNNPSQKNNGLGGYVNLNTSYEFSKKLTAFVNGNMWMSPVLLQGRYGNNYWYGVGGSYKFMKDKFTLSVNASNFFSKDQVWKSSFEDSNFRTESSRYRPARAINFSIRWNFGKLAENVSRKRGVSNDDLKDKS